MSADAGWLEAERGQALLALKRYAEAERHARRALAHDPDQLTAWAVLVQALSRQGCHAEAVRAAEAGLAHHPDSEWLHRLTSVALLRRGDPRQALASADEAARLASDVAAVHHVRSMALDEMANRPEARKAAQEAVSLAPDVAQFRARLGMACLDEDTSLAERHLRAALALDPQDAEIHNNLGVALAHQKRFAEATQAFRDAVRLDPTFKEAKQNLHGVSDPRRLMGGLAGGAGFLLYVALRYGAGNAQTYESPLTTSLVLIGVLAAAGFWFWTRREGRKRLAAIDPSLPAMRQQIGKDLRRGFDGARLVRSGPFVAALAVGAFISGTVALARLLVEPGWSVAIPATLTLLLAGMFITVQRSRRG